ncbi:MAG TPA: hypothetical protein VGB03_09205 [Acidimicrobiales bacterium]
MTGKQRLSATVDADLLEAAQEAVAAGRAENVSAWVNDALRRQVEHEVRLGALADFVSAYEEELGVITEHELADAVRGARGRAVVVRTGAKARGAGKRRTA